MPLLYQMGPSFLKLILKYISRSCDFRIGSGIKKIYGGTDTPAAAADREVVRYIKLIRNMEVVGRADALVDDLRRRYHNRPALLFELDNA